MLYVYILYLYMSINIICRYTHINLNMYTERVYIYKSFIYYVYYTSV